MTTHLALPNPGYEAAAYELGVVRVPSGQPVPMPYPYRYARAGDYDPAHPARNTVPPFVLVPVADLAPPPSADTPPTGSSTTKALP